MLFDASHLILSSLWLKRKEISPHHRCFRFHWEDSLTSGPSCHSVWSWLLGGRGTSGRPSHTAPSRSYWNPAEPLSTPPPWLSTWRRKNIALMLIHYKTQPCHEICSVTILVSALLLVCVFHKYLLGDYFSDALWLMPFVTDLTPSAIRCFTCLNLSADYVNEACRQTSSRTDTFWFTAIWKSKSRAPMCSITVRLFPSMWI